MHPPDSHPGGTVLATESSPRKGQASRNPGIIGGGVLGPITRPEVVIAGLYNGNGDLVMIGRTVPLKPAQSAQLAAVLEPAGVGHPWPDEVSSQRWGGRDSKKPLTKVQPGSTGVIPEVR